MYLDRAGTKHHPHTAHSYPNQPPPHPMHNIERQRTMEDTARTHRSIQELLALLSSADSVNDPAQRDAALLEALRTIRKEMEIAATEKDAAKTRLSDAQEVFDMAANFLAGGEPIEKNVSLTPAPVVGVVAATTVNVKSPARVTKSKLAPKTYEGSLEEPLPDNPIVMPPTYTSGGNCSEEMVASHREKFYQQLLGISAADVDNYVPNEKQPNLRSKSQLVEGMHIVENWYTGADGLDVGAFRSKHKTWYTRMKPNSTNAGRRTGIHVRALAPSPGSEGGETVLCRYNKTGDKSIVYLDVGKVFDALFEIHVIEGNHRARELCKARVDELYANIPDGQVKAFIETCPICEGKK